MAVVVASAFAVIPVFVVVTSAVPVFVVVAVAVLVAVTSASAAFAVFMAVVMAVVMIVAVIFAAVAVVMIVVVIVLPAVFSVDVVVGVDMVVAVAVTSASAFAVFVVVAFAVPVFVVMASAITVVVVMVMSRLKVVVDAGIVEEVGHLVFEFVMVNVQNGSHEVEVHPLAGIHHTMLLHAVGHVGKVQRDAGAVLVEYRYLDMTQERSAGLFLHIFSGSQHNCFEPFRNIGVESVDVSNESHRHAAGLFHGSFPDGFLLFAAVAAASVFVFFVHSFILL